jgi:adenylylsulfate kinase-like enzyme
VIVSSAVVSIISPILLEKENFQSNNQSMKSKRVLPVTVTTPCRDCNCRDK